MSAFTEEAGSRMLTKNLAGNSAGVFLSPRIFCRDKITGPTYRLIIPWIPIAWRLQVVHKLISLHVFFKKNELNLKECLPVGCCCRQQPLGMLPSCCSCAESWWSHTSLGPTEVSRKPQMVSFPEPWLHHPRSLCCWEDPYFIPTWHHLATPDIELNSWKCLLFPLNHPKIM